MEQEVLLKGGELVSLFLDLIVTCVTLLEFRGNEENFRMNCSRLYHVYPHIFLDSLRFSAILGILRVLLKG